MAGVEFRPPQFTLSLKSQEAEEGGIARFEAVVSGFPIPAVKWFHNGNDVTNSINYEISSDASGRCILFIPEVFDEDAGVFTCYAENGAGEADTTAEFIVQTKALAPDFTQHISSLSAKQGDVVRFEVKTTGLPAPRVKWYREGAEIRNSDDFRITSDGEVHTLTITEAYEEDTGRFTVTATNYIGKATSTAMLTVSGEGSVTSSRDGDFIVASPMPILAAAVHTMDDSSQAIRGRQETPQAVSDADFVQKAAVPKQPPSVLPKQRKQSPSPIRSVRMSPPRIRSVTSQQSPLPRRQIRSVKPPSPSPTRSAPPAATVAGKPEDQAEGDSKSLNDAAVKIQASFKGYKARKELEKQQESATKIQAAFRGYKTRRTVEENGPKTKPSSRRGAAAGPREIRPSQETAVYPPFFKVPIKNTEVNEGEMSQFECHIYGNPTPNLKWYREGALIESSQDFLISFDGKIGTLLIRETYIDDAGMFTCSAQNKAGSTSCSALLTVNVPETEDEAAPAYKSSDFVRSMSETDMSMTDYEGFESTELDFVSGVSEAELTDTEFVKPSVSAYHQPDSSEQVAGAAAINVLSPVAEESFSTPSGKISSRSPHTAAESITPEQQVITGSAPKIERSPENVVKIVEGDSVRLSFVISGSPPPHVTWEKNGAAVKTGYRFKLEEDLSKHSFSLTIGMLLLEDAGQYTLTATNRFGFVHGFVSLVTEAQYKHAHDAADMQSKLQVQAKNISSTQPSLLVPSPTRGRGERRTPTDGIPGIQVTTGRVASLSPGGAERFKDFDDRRSVSPSRRLDDVDTLDIEKYFKPKFLVKPLSKECNEGGATRLDCKISGRPTPEVMWYHKGVLMHEDYSHRVVVKEDGVRSLIISPATPRDGGEYTVVAHNKAGKAVSSVTITVIPKEGTERPHILEKPQSMTVNEGEMVRLEVFAVGRPTPEIVWLKDNSILIPDKNPDLRIEGVDGHGLLTIPIVSKRLHDAWYTATAVNKVGRDLTRCKVKVQYCDIEPEPEKKLYIPKSARRLTPVEPSLDRIETRKIDNFDETDLYDESRLQKPRVKKKLVSVKQKLLGSAHFECHIVPIGDPNMKVEWFHDGKPIEFANRIMTTFEFGYCSLDINAVYPRDSGVISCRATNLHGQIQTSCTLVVKDTKGLVEATQLPENRQLESIQQRDKEFRGVGDRCVPGRFDDEEEPHAPQIVLDLDPARAKEGEPARFRCRITGYPLPKVEWFLNEQSIRKSKRFRLWFDGIHYFEIATVRGYDTGEVRMVATNSQGQVESRATLEVYQAEDLRSVLHRAEKVPTTEKGDVELTVKRYRTSRSIEDQMRGENARKMVSSLKTVEKPTLTGQKKPMKKETEKELTAKFQQLSEEEHVKQAFKVGKKMPSEFRDQEYVKHIRHTRDSLTHWEEEKAEKVNIPWLERPQEILSGYSVDKVEVDLDMEAPEILERVQSLTVPKGSDAKFKVAFCGKPSPEVVWCWNGKPLELSDRISWYMTSENTSELVMRSVTKDDSGGISVRVINSAGEAGSQGFLLVKKPNILQFVEPLQNVSAKENDRSAIFECMLSERNIKVEWRHSDSLGNETVLCVGDKYQMNVDGATCYLRISNVNMKDSGSYHCIVVGQDDKRTTADLLVEAVPKKITTGIQNLTSREGYQGRFEAIVSHEGVPGTWTKNGTPIQSDGKYEIHDIGLKRRLLINDLTPEDEGTYEYVYNGDSSAANLTVSETPVNILQTLSKQTIFAGNTVTFQVKLSMQGARYNWYKDGEPVQPSERITISSDSTMYTLVIDTCLGKDAGQYTFKVGTNETSAKLIVKDINITEKLKKQSALESNTVKFECDVNERDYKDGLWLCNEKLIAQDELHVIETCGTTQSLTLTSASLQDAGLYVYVTGSGTGTEASLDVIPVTITRPLHDIKGGETKTVKLELEVSNPGVKGTWWKDGKQLEGSSKYEVGSLGKVRYLKIHSLAVDDQATYTYKAGSQSSSAHVTVKGAAISQPLHDVNVLESTDVTLECDVTGEGGEGVWTQNGIVLDFSSPDCVDEYVVTGLKHRLTLRNVQQDHAGTYQFQYGSAKTSADISVEGVKLSKALRNIHVADASDAVFAVEVAQDGVSNIRWERNGVELKPDSSKYIMSSEGRKFTLTVCEVSHADVAAYSFVAGSAKSSGRIYVESIEFIHELQDSHVMEKRTAEFVAEVDNDNVSGYWTKDGVTLKPSTKHQIQSERKVHRLIISNTSSEDSGLYKLHIGRATTSGRLTVETVHIKRKMKDESVKETQNAVFECEVSHPDITSNMYSWIKNGVEIHASESVSITVEGYAHRLNISNCSVDDSGQYTFVAGKDQCSSKLDVEVVKVLKPLTSTRKVTAHETVVFETEVDSSDINVFWTKDGRRIDFSSTITDSSSKFEARSQDRTHTLKIRDVYAEDAGVYALVAGRELTSSTLYVEVISVDITKFVKTVSVVEKHEAALEFRVSKSNVKAQWFKQGIEIDVSLPKYTYEIQDRTHKLHVGEVTFEDAGEYTFQAGNQRATTFLYIQPPEPPRFVQELRNCIVITGEPARFTVRISGRPDPVVTWYKEGITIIPSFKYKILHDEDQHTLVVVGVEESDAGEYICEAKNELGAMRTKASLEVDTKDKTPIAPPPEIKAPAIVEPIQNFITREGQSARFQCKVSGTEPKVTWFVNDKRIKPSRYFKISQYHGVHQLEITEAYPEDEGVYRVTVSNSQGEESCSAKLQLDISPPKVIEPLQPAHVIEGSPVKLECVILGDKLDVNWYVKGRDITKNRSYEWKLEQNGHCWLLKKECKITDAGEIRCHASNAAGEAVCSTDLIVSGLFEKTEIEDGVVSRRDNEKPTNNDLVDDESILHVTSSMTGREFTIRRSVVSTLAGDYISHADVDPTLSDMPVLLKSRPRADLEEDFIRPAFTQKLKSVVSEIDEMVVLECMYVASPKPDIKWFFNDKLIEFTGKRVSKTLEREMLSYNAVLRIENCKMEDAGVYKIVVINRKGECSSTAVLEVAEQISVPRLNLSDSSLHETGSKKYSASPRFPFSPRRFLERRSREGRSLSLRDQFQRAPSFESVMPISRRSTISISNSDQQDSKTSVLNDLLNGRTFLMKGQSSDNLSNNSQDQISQRNLQCQASTSSLPSESSTVREMSHMNTCLIVNGVMNRNHYLSDDTISLTSDIEAHSDIITHSTASTSGVFMMDDSIDSRRSSARKEPPVIVEGLSDNSVHLIAGERFLLSCVVSGRPKPKTVWLKDAAVLKENGEWTFEDIDLAKHGGEGFKYIISDSRAHTSHSGLYTFSAFNVAGEVTSSTRVIVEVVQNGQEKVEPPIFTKKVKATKTKPDRKVRLECELTGSSPIEVIWSKNGSELTETDLAHCCVSTDEKSPYIEFPQIAFRNAGEYTVTAKNSCGMSSCSASLIVEGR